jgi:hypothetical protein
MPGLKPRPTSEATVRDNDNDEQQIPFGDDKQEMQEQQQQQRQWRWEMGQVDRLHRRGAGLTCGGREDFRKAAGLEMRAMAVEFPEVHGHPNRLPFEGVLTLVDVASDKAPNGAKGHRVVLTRAAAEAALPSLLGMAVDYKAGWDGHDARQKCGIITAAEVDGKRLTVAGYLFARDFPEMEAKIQVEGAMGMSYELADAHVADMRAQIWTLTRATFTGAAILLRDKAAYRSTSFRLKRPVGASRRVALAR